MKKLMIALAAVALTAVSQAAVVDWQYGITGAKESYGGEYAALTGGKLQAYFFEAATWDAFESVTKESFSKALDSSGFVANGSAPQGAKYSTKKTTGEVGARTISNDSWGATMDGVYVIVDTSADAWTYTAIAKDGIATRTEQQGAGTAGSATITLQNLNAATWKTVSSGDVPEPTSGLLLLLGVAGLALRRKQA